ncbi:class I SAM-dependent methyltransferase [Arenimonas sp.]|uniref:class I SAM-dependent methyltransferase n=1 Tax=Arenimonas sp. TaxID=1872635 RepID=UPI0039E532DC
MNDEADPTPPRDHFAHIVRDWAHFGPPLRPPAGDVAAMQRAIDTLGRAPRAVVLGLTPEIVGCDWPEGTELSAVDHSPAMMRMLWPPMRAPANARAMLANWCAMPMPDRSVDVVVGDGCYVVFGFPDGYRSLTREVHRILRPSGRFVIRVFLRPDRRETLDRIVGDFEAARISSVHALKIRLWAAMHGANGPGTRPDDVRRAWLGFPPLPAGLAGRIGWTSEELETIESPRPPETRYFLPTLQEFREHMSPGFRELECHRDGGHELADLCPTFVFETTEASPGD